MMKPNFRADEFRQYFRQERGAAVILSIKPEPTALFLSLLGSTKPSLSAGAENKAGSFVICQSLLLKPMPNHNNDIDLLY